MSRAKVTMYRARTLRRWMREGAVWRYQSPATVWKRGLWAGITLGAMFGVVLGALIARSVP